MTEQRVNKQIDRLKTGAGQVLVIVLRYALAILLADSSRNSGSFGMCFNPNEVRPIKHQATGYPQLSHWRSPIHNDRSVDNCHTLSKSSLKLERAIHTGWPSGHKIRISTTINQNAIVNLLLEMKHSNHIIPNQHPKLLSS